MGAVCFEQVSPLQAPNQDWDDPARNGNRPFPERPVLIFSAANDLDEAWPLVDSAFDQLTGPSTLVTLHGTNHEYTYDATRRAPTRVRHPSASTSATRSTSGGPRPSCDATPTVRSAGMRCCTAPRGSRAT